MNTPITIASSSSSSSASSSNETGALVGKKIIQNASNNTQTIDLAGSAKSFHESIKKAYDESQNAIKNTNTIEVTGKIKKNPDGNNLPPGDDFPEIATQYDKVLLLNGLYLSGQLSDDNEITTADEIDQALSLIPGIENNIESDIDGESTLLAASAITQQVTGKQLNDDSKLDNKQPNKATSSLLQILPVPGKGIEGKGIEDSSIEDNINSELILLPASAITSKVIDKVIDQVVDQVIDKQLIEDSGIEDNGIESSTDNELALLSASAPTAIDKQLNNPDKLNEISSQLRQFFSTEINTRQKHVPSVNNGIAASNSDAVSNNIESTFIQQPEVLASKIEPAGLNADKTNFLLNNAAQQVVQQVVQQVAQQASSPNIQTSLLLQASNTQSDAAGDALPTITNVAASSFSTTPASPTIPLPTTLSPTITEAFGRAAWSQGMSKQILLMVNQNISTAEIRLNPAHLGPIEVLIDINEEQVNVSMNSRHVAVRDAMEQALPKLREMLEQNGFSLADADISKHSFAEQREQNAESNIKNITTSDPDKTTVAEATEQVKRQAMLPTSMVDYYI